jgi:4-phytase/acid phosphatase
LLAAVPAFAGPAKLKYVVIVTRHGVRSPTWNTTRLNQYSSEPWPDWGIAPGDLTPHGRLLMNLIGDYYRQWLTSQHLISDEGCADAGRVYIWSDTAERTLETGRALAESLLPHCGITVRSLSNAKSDPIFEGTGKIDVQLAESAVRERLGSNANALAQNDRNAFDALNFILGAAADSPVPFVDPRQANEIVAKAGSIDLNGPLSTASSLTEDFLLEYANGMRGKDLGWGRLNEDNLSQILELHVLYADMVRRTPYVARARGSNLLEHVLLSMEQAVIKEPVPGALGNPSDSILIISGHDTNLSNLAGILDLLWQLPSYQPNDTPPGGALIFSLWQDSSTQQLFVRVQYIAQTLDQMRDGTPLSLANPPAAQDVAIPGCGKATGKRASCSWDAFKSTVQHAIDPNFISIAPNKNREGNSKALKIQ